MNREQSLNIDPRQLQKFMSSPDFRASLSPRDSEAVQYRLMTSKWPEEAKVVYDAVQEGYTTMDRLPLVTGLTTAQIQKAITFLSEKGAIRGTTIEPASGSVPKE